MSKNEQFIATAEIFEVVWSGPRHVQVRMPPDEVLDAYRDRIGDKCAEPTETLYAIAYHWFERRIPHFL